MDSWTFNKLAGAVLASLLVIVGANTAVDILYPSGGPGEYVVVEVAREVQTAGMTGADTAGEQPVEPEQPLAVLLAAADPAGGERTARQCVACHVFEEGGPNRVGPNLYGVVGREVAAIDGFAYSSALKEYGGEWSYERLDCFLKNPKECVPGTSMGYAGIKDPVKRAEMLAYLASLGEAPPFPEAEDATKEAAAEPAEEAADPAEPARETAQAEAVATSESAQGGVDAQPAQAQDEAAEAPGQSAEAGEQAAQSAGEQVVDAGEGSQDQSELAALLASGDAAEGQKAARVCSACHTFDEGAANRVGPNLYGVVGRKVAAVESFNYSQALKDFGGEWTSGRLDCYLKNPRECVPGNKMSYPGVKDDAKRADIIAYLASLGDASAMPGGERDTGQADGDTRAASAQPSGQ